MRCILLIVLFLIFMGITGSTVAMPFMTINGISQDCIEDENQNISFSFATGAQEWTLLAELTGWEEKNNFGYYREDGFHSSIFFGSDTPIKTARTNIAVGTEIGAWMWVDRNMNGINDEYDPFLYSQRDWESTIYTRYNDYQYFYAYDVRDYKNTRAEYYFHGTRLDFSTYGNYDYLIYMDDSGVYSTDYDHNDMIIGVNSVSPVPEPGTLLLLSMGLGSAGLYFRRRK